MNATLEVQRAPVLEVDGRSYSLSVKALADLDTARANPASPVPPQPAPQPVTAVSLEPSIDDLAFYD